MKKNKPLLAALFAAALLMATAPIGSAQVDDHLKCYKMKDPLKLKALVDLNSKQFGLEAGCKVSKGLLFCVPATKTVLEAFDKRTKPPTQITPLDFPAEPAPGDRICYKISCPKPFPSGQQVTDQFGTRTVEKLKPMLLCTPAVKGDIVPATCSDAAAPACNAECPDITKECRQVPGTNICDCMPIVTECGGTFPACDGTCPNAGEECVQLATSPDCRCMTAVPVPCGNSAAPECGGRCAAADQVCKNFTQPDGTDGCECFEIDVLPNAAATVVVNGSTMDLNGSMVIGARVDRVRDDDGDGLDEIQTEIIAMDLAGQSPSLGQVILRAGKDFGLPSPGEMEETNSLFPGIMELDPLGPSGEWSVDSFFDVFVELAVDDGSGGTIVAVATDPKRVVGHITQKPPAPGERYDNPDDTPLLDPNGNVVSLGPITIVPDPVRCGGAFPECNGACPNPDDACKPSNTAGQCFCLPKVPVLATCGAHNPFPQCDGTCPAGEVCMDVQGGRYQLGECACMPAQFPCGDPANPYAAPMCWGECADASQVCRDDGSGVWCKCM